jgi:tetratricopeptide (TPR) repeat protein
MNHNDTLDPQELLHLAMAASNRHDTAQAISLLKQAIEAAPGFAQAHYLLGAEHAQLGMFDRAIEDMRRAVSQGADLPMARFQLGLLLLTSRQPDSAAQAWGPLDALGPQHSLVLLRDGLLQLARDEFAAAAASLRAGMAASTANPALNADMAKILRAIEARPPGPGAPGAPDGDHTANHLLVNAYAGVRQP